MLYLYWCLWNYGNTCSLKKKPLKEENISALYTLYVMKVFFHVILVCIICLCWQVGSLESLYTLRDSRGRPDRVTFERNLATAEGVSIFNCQIKCPWHMRIWKVDQLTYQKMLLRDFLFFWPKSRCLWNTAGNGFVTTANQNVQPLRHDCLIHLTRPRQGEFTLWRRFWFYTACICKWGFIWPMLLF